MEKKITTELWDVRDKNGNKTGRFHERGNPMNDGDYHLSVIVWIQNKKGEWLISKRSPDKRAANMWEPTGGSAIAGEESLDAALRETKEELGITLDPQNGCEYMRYTWPHSSGDGAAYIVVWVFRQEIDIADVVLQPGETCDAAWARTEDIKKLVENGQFIDYTYIDDLLRTFADTEKALTENI